MQATPVQLDRHGQQEPSTIGGISRIRPAPARLSSQADGLQFVAVCCYIFAQAFTIPVLAIGPSWTLWPQLSDLATGALFFTLVLRLPARLSLTRHQRQVFSGMLLIGGYATLSYVLLTLLMPHLYSAENAVRNGPMWGAYQLLRLFQFVIVFLAASTIEMTWKRVRFLRGVTEMTLLVVCLTVFATAFGVVPTSVFAGHLPSGESAGAWAKYMENRAQDGLGTISYNHAYTACQLILLFALRWQLSPIRPTLWGTFLLLLTLAAVFLSGSRTGLVAMMLLAFFYCRNVSTSIYVPLAILALVLGLFALEYARKGEISIVGKEFDSVEESRTYERQIRTFISFQGGDSLSGRDKIWWHRLEYLQKKPLSIPLGVGLGHSIDTGLPGNTAHMFALHVLFELGVVGLVVVGGLFWGLLKTLLRGGHRSSGMFFGTLALLLASAAGETFFPATYMGHFLGFFLCSTALAVGTMDALGRVTTVPGR